MKPNLNTIVKSDRNGQKVILTNADTQDQATAQGNWIQADHLTEVKP
jgi:hypothetical protein